MKYTIFQPKKPIFLLHICSKSSTFAGLFAKGHFSSLPIVLSFSSLPLPLSCSCQWSGKYFVYCPGLGDLRGPREILISGVLFPASIFLPLHLTPYTLHLTLRANWADGESVVTVVVAHAHVVGIEAHAPRAARVDRIERTRPVEAAACAVERSVVAPARIGEENTIAISLAGYSVTVHSFLSCPRPSTLFP